MNETKEKTMPQPNRVGRWRGVDDDQSGMGRGGACLRALPWVSLLRHKIAMKMGPVPRWHSKSPSVSPSTLRANERPANRFFYQPNSDKWAGLATNQTTTTTSTTESSFTTT